MFNLLLAASPSFTDDDLFTRKLNHLLQNRPVRTLHCLTQKYFTKMCTSYGHCEVYARNFFNDGPQTTMILYEQILQHVDAAVIFWDGETSNEKRLIEKCIERGVKHVIVQYESLKQQLARERAEMKAAPKRKRISVKLSKESIERYQAAHEAWSKRTYPQAFKDGLYVKVKPLVINSGSRMDTFIINFLVWSGWNATKVNTVGRKIMIKGKEKWIKGTTKVGTQDILCTIAGKSVRIESKHGSDSVKKEQTKMQRREREAGGISEVIYSIEDFFKLYNTLIP